MAPSGRQELRKRVLQYHATAAGFVKSATVFHFASEGVSRRTCYDILASRGTTNRITDLPRCGRPVEKGTTALKRQIKKMFDNKATISTRQAAAKLNISQSYLCKIKKKELHIKSYRKQRAPKYKQGQIERAESGARYLYRKLHRANEPVVIIMDDETYFPSDPSEVHGIEYYHTSDKSLIDKHLTVKGVEKYPHRFLVWQAISSNGQRSQPFITTGQAINGALYLQQCIKQRLLPFIDQHYQRGQVLFWPDLATAHYQKDVLAALQEYGIEVVPRKKNPPNLPQARPIERYWALVKQIYHRRKKPAKNLTSFKLMFKNDSRQVSDESVLTLMGNVPHLLYQIGYKGVYHSC
jgi:hypothetical protein